MKRNLSELDGMFLYVLGMVGSVGSTRCSFLDAEAGA